MNKTILLALLVLLALGLNAQTTIENPYCNYTPVKGLDVTKVEVTNEATFVTFHYQSSTMQSIFIPAESYIRAIGSEKKYFVSEVIGVPFQKNFQLPESGEISYTLRFPALPKTVKAFDFGEDNEGGNWFIYDIRMEKRKKKSSKKVREKHSRRLRG